MQLSGARPGRSATELPARGELGRCPRSRMLASLVRAGGRPRRARRTGPPARACPRGAFPGPGGGVTSGKRGGGARCLSAGPASVAPVPRVGSPGPRPGRQPWPGPLAQARSIAAGALRGLTKAPLALATPAAPGLMGPEEQVAGLPCELRLVARPTYYYLFFQPEAAGCGRPAPQAAKLMGLVAPVAPHVRTPYEGASRLRVECMSAREPRPSSRNLS